MAIIVPQMFSLIQGSVHPNIVNIITLFKQVSIRAPCWDANKLLTIDYGGSITTGTRTTKLELKFRSERKG